MSFKKPFQAVPIQMGTSYRARREADFALDRSTSRLSTAKLAAIGLIIGTGLGLGILAMPEGSLKAASDTVQTLAVDGGLVRARAPQPGDYWSGCNSARAAGTAPIYVGEPGYREGMDGDGDGIACEPVPRGGF